MVGQNVADALNLKVTRFSGGFVWVEGHIDGEPGHHVLQWQLGEGPNVGRLEMSERRSDVRRAVREFRDIARLAETGSDSGIWMSRVPAFCEKYGTLMGDVPLEAPHLVIGTARDWQTTLSEFLDAYDVALAIMRGNRKSKVADRITFDTDLCKVVFTWRDGRRLPVPGANETVTIQLPNEHSPRVIRLSELYRHGGDQQKLWAFFSGIVNQQLKEKLSLAIDPSIKGLPAIRPSGVLATVYARLWLDVVTKTTDTDLRPARTCAYPGCGANLPDNATSRRKYCGDDCRINHHRLMAR